MTPTGALVTMTAGNDFVLEKANGLTCIEGSGTSISVGDEEFGWTVEGGSGNPDKLRRRFSCWSCKVIAVKGAGAEGSSEL